MKKSYCRRKINELTTKMNEINRSLDRQSPLFISDDDFRSIFSDKLKELKKLQNRIDYYYSNMN